MCADSTHCIFYSFTSSPLTMSADSNRFQLLSDSPTNAEKEGEKEPEIPPFPSYEPCSNWAEETERWLEEEAKKNLESETTQAHNNNESSIANSEKFPVYIAFSKWSVPEILAYMEKYGPIHFARVMHNSNGKRNIETDRTILVMNDETYNKFCKVEHSPEIKIVPFALTEKGFPTNKENRALFVPLPKALEITDIEVKKIVNERLELIKYWEILGDKDNWKLTVPIQSRATGIAIKGCTIDFNSSVPLSRIAMARILLTDTNWGSFGSSSNGEESSYEGSDLKDFIFRCYWYDKNIHQQNNNNTNNSWKKVEKKKFYGTKGKHTQAKK